MLSKAITRAGSKPCTTLYDTKPYHFFVDTPLSLPDNDRAVGGLGPDYLCDARTRAFARPQNRTRARSPMRRERSDQLPILSSLEGC